MTKYFFFSNNKNIRHYFNSRNQFDVILMSIYNKFDMINSARLRNFSDIACNTSAHLGVSSALGALGRRFESCRPDS